ncbi:Nse4 C-terminal-domain-containing protein [Hyaloraphidium curvatum]|nr:Nse4 C-terminal-domain-containing protein [Hyaloraphidium curvatum]
MSRDSDAGDEPAELPEMPAQDEATIREIRRDYRKELENLEREKESLLNADSYDLASHVRRVDKLHKKVQRTQEAVLDSKVLKTIADIAAVKAENLRTDSSQFDVEDFIKRVAAKLAYGAGDRADLDWKAAGQVAFTFSRRPPALGFMLGPLEVKPKEKRERKVGERKRNQEAVVVAEVSAEELEKQSVQETTKLVKGVHKCLKNEVHRAGGPVDLFRFICNPDPVRGFGQTVENLFFVSFLVRDDRVRCAVSEEDGLLYIEDSNEIDEGYEAENQQAAKQGKRQLIFNLTYGDWKDAVDMYGIDRSMIPDRPAVPEAGKLHLQA